MLFTSYQFIIFMFLVFVLFYVAPKKCQVVILLAASYCFYLFSKDGYLIYIIITTLSTFFIAKKISGIQQQSVMEKKTGKEEKKIRKSRQKRWMVLCLCINLGLLFVFKYTNFFIYNMNNLWKFFGAETTIPYIDLLLPLGISFYTFQSIGYLMDVYRGKYKAEKNILQFALFVSFFPQLIQGPISRYDELSQSLFQTKKFDKLTVYSGLQRILWGYFKKLVVADRILVAVNTIINQPEEFQGTYVFLGALFYAIELYSDFTGGIDITIGIAEVFGIRLAENFKRPFFSKSVKEYWTRWHISMGTWFKDYVFYPVSVSGPIKKAASFTKKHFGKTAGKRVPVYLAAFIVWFLTGLWHGSSWNFIAWGLGNFFIIMLSEECKPFYEKFHQRFPKVGKSCLFHVFQMARTILLMSCLRMFDCYKTVSQTFTMFGTMFTDWDGSVFVNGSLFKLGLDAVDYGILFVGILLMLLVSLVQRKGQVRAQIRTLSPGLRFVIWYGLFLVVLLFGAYGAGYDATQFIYNQY